MVIQEPSNAFLFQTVGQAALFQVFLKDWQNSLPFKWQDICSFKKSDSVFETEASGFTVNCHMENWEQGTYKIPHALEESEEVK